MRITDNCISIIVPTLNEEENIGPLVSEITARAVLLRKILFVDDHSTDATRDKSCWNSRRKPAVSKLFSREWCAPAERCAYAKFTILFCERVHGKSKMSFGIALRFFSGGCTRPSSIWSAMRLRVKHAPAWMAQQSVYIQRLQESSADASRQTRLELSPNTTTITSLPGRVPLAIKHLPAASVYPVFIPLQ